MHKHIHVLILPHLDKHLNTNLEAEINRMKECVTFIKGKDYYLTLPIFILFSGNGQVLQFYIRYSPTHWNWTKTWLPWQCYRGNDWIITHQQTCGYFIAFRIILAYSKYLNIFLQFLEMLKWCYQIFSIIQNGRHTNQIKFRKNINLHLISDAVRDRPKRTKFMKRLKPNAISSLNERLSTEIRGF